MDTEMPPPPVPQLLDLTGLPEPLVRMVVEVVSAAREGRPSDVVIVPKFISRPRPTLEESRRNLAAMAAMSSGQSLPIDFSSADAYDDSRRELTSEEFRQALDRMGKMSTGQSLPLDFSSADIYDDHD